MRLKEFQDILTNRNIDLTILYNLNSININEVMFYFSNYEGLGALIIPKNKKPFLIVPDMEYTKAKKTNLKVIKWKKGISLFKQLSIILKNNKIKHKNVGIDKSDFSVLAFNNLKKYLKNSKYKDTGLDLSNIRKIKTKKEISILKKGCKITDNILTQLFKKLKAKDFKTEAQIAAYLTYKANLHGGTSFQPIVASGKNAAEPHHIPNNKKLNKGLCVIDFGIRYKGYCTDITRTVCFGKPPRDELILYNFLKIKQEKSIKNIKINNSCSKTFKDLNDSLGHFNKFFTHGLGHGIGVKIHESPNISDKSPDHFKENMIFTIEPGIYIPNKLGIRIEDDILLTKQGPKALTNTTKKLIIFPI